MKSYYALLFFFFLEYVRPTSYIPALIPLHLNLLVLYGAFASSVFGSGSPVTNEEIRKQFNTKMLLVFVTLMAMTIITSESSLVAYHTTRGVFEYVVLYVVIIKQVTTVNRMKGLFATVVLVNIAVAALTPGLLSSTDRGPALASGNFLGDANDFALSLNVALPMCLFLLFEAKLRSRILYAAMLLFVVFTIVVTQSRGGTLALLSMAVYYWLKSDKKITMGVVAAAAVATVMLLAPSEYWTRMNDIVNTEEGSSAGRIAAWNGAWRMALDHPLAGVGAGRFAYQYGANYRKSISTPFQTAHSVYFLALGELGFPGLGVVLVLIIGSLVENRRFGRQLLKRGPPKSSTDGRLLASTSASLVAFAAGGAFLSALYYPHLYVLSGLFVASRRIIRDRERSSSPEPLAPSTQAVTYHWALRRLPVRSRTA